MRFKTNVEEGKKEQRQMMRSMLLYVLIAISLHATYTWYAIFKAHRRGSASDNTMLWSDKQM